MMFDALWSTRATASADMQVALKAEAAMVARMFGLIDECLENYTKFFIQRLSLARIAAMVIVKGRNLALGCLSLTLDGLAQESGALLRPLLETIELLAYLRMFPSAVDEALEDRLPKAGEIAKRVAGQFKDLRDHLNEHASHVAISFPAMRHLVDMSTGSLKIQQSYSQSVLRKNLATLCWFVSVLALESAGTLAECTKLTGDAPVTTESLLNKVLRCRNEARRLFFPEGAEAGKPVLVEPPLSAFQE